MREVSASLEPFTSSPIRPAYLMAFPQKQELVLAQPRGESLLAHDDESRGYPLTRYCSLWYRPRGRKS